MPEVGCPYCGLPIRHIISHCSPTNVGSCWWALHECRAVINTLRPHLFIPPPTQHDPEESP